MIALGLAPREKTTASTTETARATMSAMGNASTATTALRASMSHERSSPKAASRALLRRRLVATTTVVLIAFALALPALAAALDDEITSDEGPLTRIIISTDLNCQVAHRDDSSLEFFGGDVGACGTFLAFDGEVYGPASLPAGTVASTPWTPVRQEPVTGSGRSGDPFRLVTVVEAGEAGIRVEQADEYQVGEEWYRTDVRISNSGGSEQSAILYRAGDCYLQDSDVGFGRVDDGAPGCVISREGDARIEQWVPITSGSSYLESGFQEVWDAIGSREPFPNQCRCDQAVDNGAGLSWEVVIPAGGSVEVSHLTFFSPEGRRPVITLRDSVPGPADVTLDPVVLAISVALAAGVVLFVPFPAALFNSTLEEHYAEVTAAVARLRAWLRRALAAAWARLRGAISEARARRAAGSSVTPTVSPAPAAETPAEGSSRRFALDDAFWRSPLGILAFVAVSALLYGLLDPTFGLDLSSLATYLGLALGLIVMIVAFGVPLLIGARAKRIGVSARALPGTLLVGVGCVLISRIADFQPGYLYGLIIGFAFSRELTKVESGKLEAFASGLALLLAVASWVLLPVARSTDAAEGQPFTAAMVETALATVVVAGLEAAAISMMPLRFLPGERVRAWNQRVWIAILGIAAFGFCHLLLNPSSGYLADSTRSSLLTVILLLVAFGGGSVLFWAYFRFGRKPGPDGAPSPPMPSPEAPGSA